MKLHVLTAVSRPENLSDIASSLAAAHDRAPGVDLTWHLRFDPWRKNVGGQALKNAMIDQIEDGWVWILDDDTLVHEDLFSTVAEVAEEHVNAIVVSQRRSNGRILHAAPKRAVLGSIDAGQALLKVSLIADYRIPLTYAGDGIWLETLLHDRDDVLYLDSVLSLHNAISGVEVSAR